MATIMTTIIVPTTIFITTTITLAGLLGEERFKIRRLLLSTLWSHSPVTRVHKHGSCPTLKSPLCLASTDFTPIILSLHFTSFIEHQTTSRPSPYSLTRIVDWTHVVAAGILSLDTKAKPRQQKMVEDKGGHSNGRQCRDQGSDLLFQPIVRISSQALL